jgi:hypothetical protein
MPYNPLYFRIKNAEGYEYLPGIGAPDTSLQAGSLAQGKSVRNIVIFEIPEKSIRVLLLYQPSLLFEDYPAIRFMLELQSG